jgi:hypothetical protein
VELVSELVTTSQADRQRPAWSPRKGFLISLKKPKSSKLMTYKEITVESAEKDTKQTNVFCGNAWNILALNLLLDKVIIRL